MAADRNAAPFAGSVLLGRVCLMLRTSLEEAANRLSPNTAGQRRLCRATIHAKQKPRHREHVQENQHNNPKHTNTERQSRGACCPKQIERPLDQSGVITCLPHPKNDFTRVGRMPAAEKCRKNRRENPNYHHQVAQRKKHCRNGSNRVSNLCLACVSCLHGARGGLTYFICGLF